ncbi:MAG: thiamine pyrophosphate-binding protein [Haloarculaceae archaeon]
MSANYTGAELFVDALEQYGVEHVFGNPGTTELPVMDALSRADTPEYVLGLHEDVAVGMATGYAQTRRYHAHRDPSINPAGVVNLHITPGLAHGIGNVYAASFAGAPLVVTAGNHELDFRHEEPLLHGELEEMVDQFCKWSDEVLSVDALPTMLRRAFRVALTPPTGPVFLALPVDVMMDETDAAPERLGPIPSAGPGDPTQIEAATEAIVEAETPVLVLGDHVARAGGTEAAVDLAEASGARVHSEILASEVSFPRDHDQWVSTLPPDENTVRSLLDTDLVAFVGTSTNTTLLRHEEPLFDDESTFVHVSDDAWEVGKNQSADVAVVGDPGEAMAAIADRVGDRLDASTRQDRLDAVAELRELVQDRMARVGAADPDDPRASKGELVDALRSVAPDAYVVDEGVTSRGALLTRWPFAPEQNVSNKGGGLGYGLPASIGAALAESMTDDPRETVGFVGDGSYLYYPHSVYSASRLGLDLTVVVSDNRNYRILKDNTVSMLGGEETDYEFVGMDFEPPVDIPKNAESHGARGHLVDDPDAIADVFEDALGTPGVDVLDVLVHD